MKLFFRGIEDGRLPDEHIKSSSEYGQIFAPHNARLNKIQGKLNILTAGNLNVLSSSK